MKRKNKKHLSKEDFKIERRSPREFIEYIDKKGNNPVREYLNFLNVNDRKKIEGMIFALKSVERLGSPYYKLFSGYFINIGELIIGDFRIFVSKIGVEKYLLVHGFRKKSNNTPKAEISIAVNRILDFIKRYQDEKK